MKSANNLKQINVICFQYIRIFHKCACSFIIQTNVILNAIYSIENKL